MRPAVAGVRPAPPPRAAPMRARPHTPLPPVHRVTCVPRVVVTQPRRLGRPSLHVPTATGASGPGTGRADGPLASPLTVFKSAGTDLKAVLAAARGAVDEDKGGKGSKFVPMVLL